MTTGPQRHPSRDRQQEHEHEYEPVPGGVHLSPGGLYHDDEISHATEYWKSEGGLTDPEVRKESGGILNPAQGRLFDSGKHEAANRQKLGRSRLQSLNPDENGDFQRDEAADQIRNKALESSTIPTSHLQPREPGIRETRIKTTNDGREWQGSGAAGWYRGPSGKQAPDVIAIDPNSSHGTDTTMIHEMGHRRHLGEGESHSDFTTHPKGLRADPLKEGVADAYVDRYGGPLNTQVRPMREDIEAGAGQKFTSYNFTGYSSDKQAAGRLGWGDTDRALYAATRAHASETGEQALYVPQGRHGMENQSLIPGGGDPTTDATLHHLLSTSPHAAQALRQTGLKDVGAAAFRRHRDRQLLTQGQAVQGALFHELKGVDSGEIRGYAPNVDAMSQGTFREKIDAHQEAFDTAEAAHGEQVWPEHMSHNQFGEKPRTSGDVYSSLGVTPRQSKTRGF